MKEEIWKTLKEDPGFEINNFGSIRNKESGRLKVPYMNGGHLRVNLPSGRYYVHRLVMSNFGDVSIDNKGVRHLDGNPYNNDIENLARCIDSAPLSKRDPNLVKVVRCGDCVHRTSDAYCMTRPDDWYCPDGEKA